jgi:hypothetical protein
MRVETDAFDGGNTAERLEPIRHKTAKGSPGAFELVDFSQQRQKIPGYLDGIYF